MTNVKQKYIKKKAGLLNLAAKYMTKLEVGEDFKDY